MGISNEINVGIRHPESLYIDGKWVDPVEGRRLRIVSPDTEEAFAEVAEATAPDIDLAVAAARRAFDEGPWPHMPAKERARYLLALGEALKARDAELAAVWTAQIGGLAHLAAHPNSIGHNHLLHTAGLVDRFSFEEEAPTSVAASALIVHEPIGVVAAIAPWNAPYMLMTAKLGPALLAGCTVVMKPAPETPLEAYIIAECAEEVGLPAGVLNLVPADRAASEHLVRDPRVDMVAFTGSTAVGRQIASICGERLSRYTLELGGKSAAIVLDDFPVDDAAKLLAGTITLMSGQICAMLSRAIVSKHRHDELAEAIAREMKQIRIGHATDPNAQMGPLASQRQLERVESYIETGKAEGADLVTGGQRPSQMSRGFFMEPTLFANVDNKSTIAQEEIFGPVLSLIPSEDVDDAIRIANESSFGLHGSVLSSDADMVYKIGRKVRTGSFAHNGLNVDFDLPFGGCKLSGVGREGGIEGLKAFTEAKTMLFNAKPNRN